MLRKVLFILISATALFCEPLSLDEAFKLKASANDEAVVFKFQTDSSVYLYKKDLKFNIDGADITAFLNFPEPKLKDSFEIYKGELAIEIPFGVLLSSKNYAEKALDRFNIEVFFSGCADDGFCYEPQKISFKFIKSGDSYEISSQKINPKKTSVENEIEESFFSKSTLWLILSFFGYGLFLSLTPCTLPMIPIVSSIILSNKKNPQSSGFLLSFVYVLGVAFVYAIAGVGAAMLGASVQAYLQTPFVIVLFALFFVLLSLSMFGLFEIKMPSFITNFSNKKLSQNNSANLAAIFITGALSALVVGPCIAPPLAGALLYIASSKDILLGGAALFVLGIGSGVPLLILGFGSDKLLPKPGFWMNEVSRFFGFLLLFMAIWILGRVIEGNITLLLYSIVGFVMVGALGFFEAKQESLYSGIKKGFLFFVLTYSVILLVSFASGGKDALRPLDKFSATQSDIIIKREISTLTELEKLVKSAKRAVVVDFWASWCVECGKLDRLFLDSDIQSLLDEFIFVKVDVTHMDSNDKELMAKFKIFGPPALIFYKNGVEQKELQTINPDKNELIGILKSLK